MSTPYVRAPHTEGSPPSGEPLRSAPNAALLIDFDNVTMGMRSDLSKELKHLLGSDFIRGKVTVQRAYADWRRYPQYIVPLSEASIDLIFAPAYGSNKKNATDIRMAIDGMELVFTRPEIGTYILLTGDSDFSSLVLKLKEYGKYVIGVGIQESSSDILVQNCDEYYSYTSLTGLRKTTEGPAPGSDPWVLVEKAVKRMAERNDVMRSDRLKQVMLEMDSGFDEGTYGFSKFSKFLAEAASRGILRLRRLENGQHEVAPAKNGKGQKAEPRTSSADEGKGRDRRHQQERSPSGGRARKEERRSPAKGRREEESGARANGEGAPAEEPATVAGLPEAYDLLRRAVRDLAEDHGGAVRDSDVKRRMLALHSSFDETALGFPKFSRFLRRSHDDEVVDLRKGDDGNYRVALRDAQPRAEEETARGRSDTPRPGDSGASEAEEPTGAGTGADEGQAKVGSEGVEAAEPSGDDGMRVESGGDQASRGGGAGQPRLRPRTSARRPAKKDDAPPPLFEGQVVRRSGGEASSSPASREAEPSEGRQSASESPPEKGARQDRNVRLDPQALKLPTDREAMTQYLNNSYKGVGKKTAEALVKAFGDDLFHVLHTEPQKVREVVPHGRAEKVLEGWKTDYARRKARLEAQQEGEGKSSSGRSPDGGAQQADGDGGPEAAQVQRSEAPGGKRGETPSESESDAGDQSSPVSRRRTRPGRRGSRG